MTGFCFPARALRILVLALVCFQYSLVPSARAAGVTIVTHGLNSNVDDWVIAMAGRMTDYYRFPGTNSTCYELYFTLTNSQYVLSWRRLDGSAPPATDSGEILIKLDWRQLANNSYSTYQVAALVAPRLRQSDFIPEMQGHALAELPLHLIGHSRGGSLVCELSRLLGTNGVWVDHLTTLDPHPLNNDGFNDAPFYTVVDASARTYENVLFHDNYYQTLNLIAYGEPVAGAYVRRLTNLDGGYGGFTASHSDVHLWYHGTVDLRIPADDTVAEIDTNERQIWWTSNETYGATAGYYYSRIGGGDRLSAAQPAGPGTSEVRDGYNQMWNFGAGTDPNRTALPSNNGNWPNIMRVNLAGTNLMAQGQSNTVTFYYQWARPAASNASVTVFLDDDFNPYNGNERPVRQMTVTGTTAANVGLRTPNINVAATNTTPGIHSIYAKITGGERTRYLYAPELLTVFSSFRQPALAITRETAQQVRVHVNGIAGQRVVLESTTDFRNWQSLATNWLSTNTWTYVNRSDADAGRFYRAAVK